MRMSQIWQGEKVVPVTVIQALNNKVALLRTKDKDGYSAVQLKAGPERQGRRAGKTIAREFRTDKFPGWAEMKLGDEIKVDTFSLGDKVRVSGTTKGRGFQGVVKRHGFHGGPKTHGQKNRHRAPGSIGSTAFQRVVPGRRMAGHMGDVRMTIKNLEVVGVDPEKGTLMLKGAVPGATGGILEIIKIKSAK